MDEYWLDRAERKMAAGDKEVAEMLKTMKSAYKNSLKDIEKEINAFYGKYATKNNLTLSEVKKRLDPSELKSAYEETVKYYNMVDPSKIGPNMAKAYRDELRLQSAKSYMSRLEELKMSLKHQVIQLGAEELKTFTKGFQSIFKTNYAMTNYDLDKFQGFSTGFVGLNYKKLNSAISQKWLGDNYSDRIWKNKSKLLHELNTTLIKGIAQGQNPKKIAVEMSKNYGTSYYNCERLCRTEAAHIMGEATLQGYKDRGRKEYEYVATLDHRTSEECKHLDGKIFKTKDAQAGINYPPMHPNCRSTTAPYFPKDNIDQMFEESTRIARDNNGKSYYVPASMTYMQWQNNDYKKPTQVYGLSMPDEKIITNRFDPEFTDFINKSQEYWNKDNEDYDQLTQEEKNVVDAADAYINDKDSVLVRHNSLDVILDNWDDFIKDPRLKTQFETGTSSSGGVWPEERNKWENNLSPYSDKYYKTGSAKYRPGYGEIIKRSELGQSSAKGYGDCDFILNKKQVENRTSYTMGNSSWQQQSFQKSFAGALLRNRDKRNMQRQVSYFEDCFDNYQNIPQIGIRRRPDRAYVECQVWGGIDLSKGDVSEILIDKTYLDHKNFNSFKSLMKKYNVKITVKE